MPTDILSVEYVRAGGFVEGILVTWDADVTPAMAVPARWRVVRERAGVTEPIPVQSVAISDSTSVYLNLNDDDLQAGDEASVIFLGVVAAIVPAKTVSVGIV